MPLTISEPYGSGEAVADRFPHANPAPPGAPSQGSRPPTLSTSTLLQPLPRLGSLSYSPTPSLQCVDLPTPCSASEITCHSPTITTARPAATENTVRLTPIFDHPNRLALRMGIVFCDPSQLFLLQGPDGVEARVTMGEVLRRYCTRIASIDFNATAVPNPKDPETMACAIALPFSPDALASEASTYPHLSPQRFPVLSALEDLSITTSRAPSIYMLLRLLQYTPLLQRVAITNHRDHQAVLPDDVAKLAAPMLPYLDRVAIDGLLTNAVAQLLEKLLPSLARTPRPAVSVHFRTPTFPAFNHDAVMRTLFATATHANLAYLALSPSSPSPSLGCDPERDNEDTGAQEQAIDSSTEYLFTLSDGAGRATLAWHWAEAPGARPSLGHIGLATHARALAGVRTLSLALYGMRPVPADLLHVLQPFSRLAHIELHALSPHPHFQSQSQSQSQSKEQGTQGTQGTQGAFRLRAAPVVRRLADVPALFALGLARWVSSSFKLDQSPRGTGHAACPRVAGDALPQPGPRAGSRAGAGRCVCGAEPWGSPNRNGSEPRLTRTWYRPLWAAMVRKPEPEPEPEPKLTPHPQSQRQPEVRSVA